MKKSTKIISLLSALLIAVFGFSGCSFIRPSAIATVKNNTDGKVTKIPMNDYLYNAYVLHASAENYASQQKTTTKELLNQKAEGQEQTYNDYFKDQFKKQLTEQAINLLKFNEYKFSLTDEEKNSTDSQYEQLSSQLGAATLSKIRAELRVTEQAFKNMLIEQSKAQTLKTKLFDAGAPFELKEDAIKKDYEDNYVRIKHILIATQKDDGSGQKVDLTEAEIKEKEKTANDLLAQINKGADFDKLMAEKSEDPGSKSELDGYFFKKDGKMVKEFEEAAFSMKIGEVKIVKTSFGYHIMKKLDHKEKADFYTKNKESVKTGLQDEKYKALQDEWTKQYTITFDDKALNTYSLVNLKDIASK